MSDGACEGLPAAPFDLEKEDLVTSTVKLNTDNLKKTVRWLVQCVQDQQQTLARHGQRLDTDSASFAQSRPGSVGGVRSLEDDNSGSIQKEMTGPLSLGASTRSLRTNITDGFGVTLQGELLDMKINAVNRQMKAELPRMCDFDSERARMLADVASLQQDLSKRFQEADRKVHEEMATSTGKLFEQLNRISTEVLSRIEALEGRFDANGNMNGSTSQVTYTSPGKGPASSSSPTKKKERASKPNKPKKPSIRTGRRSSNEAHHPSRRFWLRRCCLS